MVYCTGLSLLPAIKWKPALSARTVFPQDYMNCTQRSSPTKSGGKGRRHRRPMRSASILSSLFVFFSLPFFSFSFFFFFFGVDSAPQSDNEGKRIRTIKCGKCDFRDTALRKYRLLRNMNVNFPLKRVNRRLNRISCMLYAVTIWCPDSFAFRYRVVTISPGIPLNKYKTDELSFGTGSADRHSRIPTIVEVAGNVTLIDTYRVMLRE